MKKILSTFAATIAIVSFAYLPAGAADVDININTDVNKALQLNLAGLNSGDAIVLDQTNVVESVSIVGEKINDVNISQKANKVGQGNGVIADAAKKIKGTQTNAVLVASLDFTSKDWSDINIAQKANKVFQGNGALLGAGGAIDLSQVNALGATNISVNAPTVSVSSN